MKKKYFLKSQSNLQRKAIAGTLSAVFGAGMYGSYAGAMNPAPTGIMDFAQFFNNLEKAGNEENIKKIEYTNLAGVKDEVECKFENNKIKFKMYGKEQFGGLAGNYKGYWVSFRGYEGEKDNDVVGFIRDKFHTFGSFDYVGSSYFTINELISYSKKEEKTLSLTRDDIIFEYLKYCKNVLNKSLKDSYEVFFNNFEEENRLDKASLKIFMTVLVNKFPELKTEKYLNEICSEIDTTNGEGEKFKQLKDILEGLKANENKGSNTTTIIEEKKEELFEVQNDYADKFEKIHKKSRYKLYITLGIIFLILFLGGGAVILFSKRDSKEGSSKPDKSVKDNKNKEQIDPKNTKKDKETENDYGQAGPSVVETKIEGKSNVVRNVAIGTAGATATTSLVAAGIYAKNKSKSGVTEKTVKENKNTEALVYVDSKKLLETENKNSDDNTSKDSTVASDEELNIAKDNENEKEGIKE